ncbi:MAG: hypothetical protein PHQ32_00490 [Firmicutes bacterium]|nr:hypothetical protein [Bacillota bacterium]
MKKIIISILLFIGFFIILSGCQKDNNTINNDFKTKVLTNLRENSIMTINGTFEDGYFESEGFKTEEHGKLENGLFKLSVDSNEYDDYNEIPLDERIVEVEFKVDSSEKTEGYYGLYLAPLDDDLDYVYKELDDGYASLTYEEKSVDRDIIEDIAGYFYTWKRYYIEASKVDAKVRYVKVDMVEVISYNQIDSDIDSLYESDMADFGKIASKINNSFTDPLDFGVYGKVKFSAEFK